MLEKMVTSILNFQKQIFKTNNIEKKISINDPKIVLKHNKKGSRNDSVIE